MNGVVSRLSGPQGLNVVCQEVVDIES